MAPSLSKPRHLYLSAPPYLKWDGNRDLRPSSWTIPLQWALQLRNFSKKQYKAMDVRFYWISNRIKQGKFQVFWRPDPENLGDYHSKHHPHEHYITFRSKYLHVPNLRSLQGCFNLTVRVNPTKRESQRAQLE